MKRNTLLKGLCCAITAAMLLQASQGVAAAASQGTSETQTVQESTNNTAGSDAGNSYDDESEIKSSNITDEDIREICSRARNAIKEGRIEVDISDLDLEITAAGGDFDEMFRKLQRSLTETGETYGSFIEGNYRESYTAIWANLTIASEAEQAQEEQDEGQTVEEHDWYGPGEEGEAGTEGAGEAGTEDAGQAAQEGAGEAGNEGAGQTETDANALATTSTADSTSNASAGQTENAAANNVGTEESPLVGSTTSSTASNSASSVLEVIESANSGGLFESEAETVGLDSSVLSDPSSSMQTSTGEPANVDALEEGSDFVDIFGKPVNEHTGESAEGNIGQWGGYYDENGNYVPYTEDPSNRAEDYVIDRVFISYDSYVSREDRTLNLGLVNELQTKITSEYQRLLGKIDGSMSDAEKALALYDELILATDYPDPAGFYEWDNQAYYDMQYSNAYSAFGLNQAICTGMARAYAFLLNDAGIEAMTVDCSDISHEWVMLKIDGKWYHADPTWDNPRFENGVTAKNEYNSDHWDIGHVQHDYFLKTDSEMRDLGHPNWYTAYDYCGYYNDGEYPVVAAELDSEDLVLHHYDYSSAYSKAAPAGVSRDGAFRSEFFAADQGTWSTNVHFQAIDGYWYFGDDGDPAIRRIPIGGKASAAETVWTPAEGDVAIYTTASEQGVLFILTRTSVYAVNISAAASDGVIAPEEMLVLKTAESILGGSHFSEMAVRDGRLMLVVVTDSQNSTGFGMDIEQAVHNVDPDVIFPQPVNEREVQFVEAEELERKIAQENANKAANARESAASTGEAAGNTGDNGDANKGADDGTAGEAVEGAGEAAAQTVDGEAIEGQTEGDGQNAQGDTDTLMGSSSRRAVGFVVFIVAFLVFTVVAMLILRSRSRRR